MSEEEPLSYTYTTVCNQEEFDQALADRISLIQINSYRQPIVIRDDTPGCVIEALENSEVFLRGNAEVEAYGHSLIHAADESFVRAYDNSAVIAHGNSRVAACEMATVSAYDSSVVDCLGHCRVDAHDSSHVRARGGWVSAWNTAHVAGSGRGFPDYPGGPGDDCQPAQVELHDSTTAILCQKSSATCYDDSHVETHDMSQANLFNRSTADAYDSSRIAAWDNSYTTTHDPTVTLEGNRTSTMPDSTDDLPDASTVPTSDEVVVPAGTTTTKDDRRVPRRAYTRRK